jgi:DNA-directed RNA polymerase subunit F
MEEKIKKLFEDTRSAFHRGARFNKLDYTELLDLQEDIRSILHRMDDIEDELVKVDWRGL